MKFTIDHDLHIHSTRSMCCKDEAQTTDAILKYALENKLQTICLTDHFWDDAVPGANNFYKPQNYEHVSSVLPLPENDDVRFLFGCETDISENLTLGISDEKIELFDFIIIPTTHLHMMYSDYKISNPRKRADTWVRRFNNVLERDLPFGKIGIAHPTCRLIARDDEEEFISTLNLIPEREMENIFSRAKALGVGIELNMSLDESKNPAVLRPYEIAKSCGCKFYLGSDAHSVNGLNGAGLRFEAMINALSLEENDKFIIQKKA